MVIIQKYLQTIHNIEYINFIYECIKENFLEITDSKHGICIVQKYNNESEEIERTKIINLLCKNLDNGINGQFINYVIQYLLMTDNLEYKEIKGIIDKISENICSYYKKHFLCYLKNFLKILKNILEIFF